MQRDIQEGKPRFDLIFPKIMPYKEQCITRFAELMARGATKYDARNWEKASGEKEMERFKASATRHFIQWLCNEEDEDHLVATWFNMQGYEYVKWKLKNK